LKYKSSGTDQILAEQIKAVGEILLSVIHKLINSVWNKEELPDQWKKSIVGPIHKKGDKTYYNNYRGISLLLTSNEKKIKIKIKNIKTRIYKTITLRVVLYGCETWSLILREEHRPLGRPRHRLVDNIKTDLGEVGWGDVDSIGLAQDRNRWRALVNSVINLRVP
jgi:hypothetical protein